jgi:hypothetical protein
VIVVGWLHRLQRVCYYDEKQRPCSCSSQQQKKKRVIKGECNQYTFHSLKGFVIVVLSVILAVEESKECPALCWIQWPIHAWFNKSRNR